MNHQPQIARWIKVVDFRLGVMHGCFSELNPRARDVHAAVSVWGRQANRRENLRDDLVFRPSAEAENGAVVGAPDGDGTLGRDIPEHDPAVSVAGQQALVVAQEAHGVDVSVMTAEDISRLSGRALELRRVGHIWVLG